MNKIKMRLAAILAAAATSFAVCGALFGAIADEKTDDVFRDGGDRNLRRRFA